MGSRGQTRVPYSNMDADGHLYLNIGPHSQRTQYIYSCLVTIINSTFQLPKTNGLIITIITLVENSYIEPKEGQPSLGAY